MHIVDLVILVFIGASAWNGYRTGAVGQVLRIVGTFASYWIALRYHSLLVPIVERLLAHTSLQQNTYASGWIGQGASFIVTFMLASLVFSFVSMALQGIFELPGLSILNRIAGVLFGTALSVFVVAILIQITKFTHIPAVDTAMNQSRFAQSFTQVFSGGLHSLQEVLQSNGGSDVGTPSHVGGNSKGTSKSSGTDPFHIT